MINDMKKILMSFMAMFGSFFCIAQDSLVVYNTFLDKKIINLQTNETMDKGKLDFSIIHRFDDIASANAGIHTLYGIQNVRNVRFGFDYGVTDNFQVGFGRSKTQEHVDGSLKYKLLKQKRGSSPVSVSLYTCMAITPKVDIDSLYAKTIHRASYCHQVIVSRKFGEKLSLAVLPTIQHRNAIKLQVNTANGAEDENTLLAFGFGGKYQVSKVVSVTAEYLHVQSDFRRNNADVPYYAPLALGVELNTGGHLFQLNLANSSGISENDLIPSSLDSWSDGGVKFGFTISRVFKLK